MSQVPEMDAVNSALRDSEAQGAAENFAFKDRPSQATVRWLKRRNGRRWGNVGKFLLGAATGAGVALAATHLPLTLPFFFFKGLGDKLGGIFAIAGAHQAAGGVIKPIPNFPVFPRPGGPVPL
ncbi:MAG: hypothetical protein ACREGI_01260 [Candidatus Levyibacteriota bacterium]